MIKNNRKYKARDLSLIIPTKDRPEKIKNLMKNIAAQTASCGRVIVVDGGKSVMDVVLSFSDRLDVEYYECRPPGQIRQRNIGIGMLNAENRLVGFLDDDLMLEANAVEEMIALWNSVDAETAGIGFNIVNEPMHQYSKLRHFFCMDHVSMGRVLSSGINTSINNISNDIKTQWLGGGYTVWRHQILNEFPQKNLNTKWAVGEDLRFSYPIGKQYPLYVSARAKVHHHHIHDQAAPGKLYGYRGRKVAMASVYFVLSHKELSLFACYWMLSCLAAGKFIKGFAAGDNNAVSESTGYFHGIFGSLFYIAGLRDRARMLEDAND